MMIGGSLSGRLNLTPHARQQAHTLSVSDASGVSKFIKSRLGKWNKMAFQN